MDHVPAGGKEGAQRLVGRLTGLEDLILAVPPYVHQRLDLGQGIRKRVDLVRIVRRPHILLVSQPVVARVMRADLGGIVDAADEERLAMTPLRPVLTGQDPGGAQAGHPDTPQRIGEHVFDGQGMEEAVRREIDGPGVADGLDQLRRPDRPGQGPRVIEQVLLPGILPGDGFLHRAVEQLPAQEGSDIEHVHEHRRGGVFPQHERPHPAGVALSGILDEFDGALPLPQRLLHLVPVRPGLVVWIGNQETFGQQRQVIEQLRIRRAEPVGIQQEGLEAQPVLFPLGLGHFREALPDVRQHEVAVAAVGVPGAQFLLRIGVMPHQGHLADAPLVMRETVPVRDIVQHRHRLVEASQAAEHQRMGRHGLGKIVRRLSVRTETAVEEPVEGGLAVSGGPPVIFH